MSTWLTAGKRVLRVSLCAGVCGKRCKNMHHPRYISRSVLQSIPDHIQGYSDPARLESGAAGQEPVSKIFNKHFLEFWGLELGGFSTLRRMLSLRLWPEFCLAPPSITH